MKVEVLVSTMECQDYEQLYNKMNLQTDAIIINQTNDTLVGNLEKQIENSVIRGLSFQEKGIGLSRNNALMRSNGEICLMADDDMVYVDKYKEIVEKNFLKHPDADMLIFNVRIHQDGKINEKVKSNGRVRFWNALRYGTVCFAFKKQRIHDERIYFSLLFGGGTNNGSGEDTLFITDLLKRKVKIYSVKEIIADVYNDKSTWFDGYNTKYLLGRGALFYAIDSKLYLLLIIQYAFRKNKLFPQMNKRQMLKIMFKGSKEKKNDKS